MSPTSILMERPTESTMQLEDRRRLIVELVHAKGSVTTEELSARYHTSLVTIRSDLKALAETGVLARTHGGAIALRDHEEVPIHVKETLRMPEKARIAAAAAAMIRDGETVLLDSGSTTAEIAKRIRAMPLQSVTVITNALNVAVILAHAPHVKLVMLGGLLGSHSFSMAGPMAEAALADLHADRLFLGASSLAPEAGVMTANVFKAQLNARMVRCAREVVVVADSSKLARRNLSVAARIEQIHKLITDGDAPSYIVTALRQRGLQVQLV